jgi:hypothetical protein
MALSNRANVAGAQAAVREMASQDHVAVHFEGHVLRRVRGNKSRHIGASVNLTDGTKLDTAAVGCPDRSHHFIHDAVRVLMRACDVERKVLSAQIGLEDGCRVGSISRLSNDLAFAAPRLCDRFSRNNAAGAGGC